MTNPPSEEKTRIRRVKTGQAIQFAVENKWQEAIDANAAVLELFPTDVDAQNRTGKALMELGRYKNARKAYQKSLKVDPNNAIARKNLARLKNLDDVDEVEPAEKLELDLFIAETGKTGYSILTQPAEREILARLTAGDKVEFKVTGGQVAVHHPDGQYLGMIEPKIGLRLATLIDGGNKYIAAVQSASEEGTQIVIRETHQDPKQAGKLSFPAKGGGAEIRAYTKDSLVRQNIDGEDIDNDDDDENDDWPKKRATGADGEDSSADDAADNDEDDE